ncbi:transcription termination/antitermination protein NusA [Sphingobacteriales bacterium UPWRP_1]|nr:transcription termination/antitermination protein NusA [Sphingobacteriales bacterium UPWRP_1]
MAVNTGLVGSFSEFKDLKNIDRPTLMKVLDDVFRTLLRKKYNSDENFDIIVNTDKGDLEIWRKREIVPDDEVVDSNKQVAYSEAVKIEEDFEIGEELYEQINLLDFGRRAILSARQTLMSRITELQKDELYRKYSERIGEIVSGEVYQVWQKELLVLDDDENELILPKSEMIHGDIYKKGDAIRAIVKKVEMRNSTTPRIILSRTSNGFLAKLLELEVPEIFDNIILVKRIAREPGERAKVAVESTDDRIDPVGACVGMKGSRIHGIVRELRNENIDIINFTNNTRLFIQRALTPAKVVSIEVDETAKRASVYLKPDQVSLAIGKGGINIKLASKLTGYEIDVYRDVEEEEYDIELDEFADEIDNWIIDDLKRIGCDTARSVLDMRPEDLVRLTNLEEETIQEVIRILKSEFEDED